MRKLVFVIAGALSAATAQTQIDLRTQVKPESRPVKVSTTLPSSCTPGDLLLKTDAPAGANLYACTSSNQWIAQSGQGGVTLLSDGTMIGTRTSQNLIAGAGIVNAVSDTGFRLDVIHMMDSAVVQTRANTQSGGDVFCASTSGSANAYTCSMTPTLTAYSQGMSVLWKPDVTNVGGPTTLSIDTLDAIPVKMDDGVTDPAAADLRAGQAVQVWYDGAEFRVLRPASIVRNVSPAARPACDSAQRGRIWHTMGASGAKDEVSVCAKDATDQFAWRTVY